MEVYMDTRKITAYALIVPPALAIIGWLIFGFIAMDGVGPDKPQEYMAGLGENSTLVRYMFPIITLLFLMAIGGLGAIKNSMEGGSGYFIASFGFFLLILGSAAQLGEVAFTIQLAEAVEVGNMAVASNAFASGQSIGAVATAFSGIAVLLIGVGILQQKNFTPLVAGLMIIAGIFLTVFSIVDYESPLMAIGYLGWVVSLVWLGASLLTKNE